MVVKAHAAGAQHYAARITAFLTVMSWLLSLDSFHLTKSIIVRIIASPLVTNSLSSKFHLIKSLIE